MSTNDKTQAIKELISETKKRLPEHRKIDKLCDDCVGEQMEKLLSVAENYLELREALEEIAHRDWLPTKDGNDWKWINEFKDISKQALESSDFLLESL